MLAEMRRLHKLGFAIHWLHPRSKEPVGSWSTPTRKTLIELEQSHIPQTNIGTRLGGVSKVAGGFLAAIDCDVKSAEPRFLLEMRARFRELFPELPAGTPIVASGRGNGSLHIYCRTASPIKGDRLAQSSESVRVFMPSAKRASENEKKILTADEIARGWRIRPAWEISFMSEGRQVVLPPSIHPDSGKPYKWLRRVESALDLPLVVPPVGSPTRAKVSNVDLTPFKVVVVDLEALGVANSVINMIDHGAGGDRSTELFLACIALVKARLTNEQILSCLTDQTRTLGQVAFEHAKTENRARAAAWLEKYTLAKARVENDAAVAFSGKVEISSLSEEENAASHAAVELLSEWKTRLEVTGEGASARPKISFKNIKLILLNAVGDCVYRYNAFAGQEEHACSTPWGSIAGKVVTDADILALKDWLIHRFRLEANVNLLNEVVTVISRENSYHPVRSYLSALQWDGRPRIDSWLNDYLGVTETTPYVQAIARKVLVAMVARIYSPGIKFDYVLILEGGQGKRKSTALEYLTGKWFSDQTLDVRDKDSVLAMNGRWLLELGELSTLRRAEVDSLKEFISRRADRIRLPYGKRTEEFPRQCIFVGTTNRSEYFNDETGNRRFWPIEVGQCFPERLEKVRDQLFAEARIAWEFGEPLYLENKDVEAEAIERQALKMESDAMTEEVSDFLRADQANFPVKNFTMGQAFSAFGPFAKLKNDWQNQRRAGKILRVLGYQKRVIRDGNELSKQWTKEEN